MELTTQEVTAIYVAACDSVTLINGTKDTEETDAEWKDRVKRNVEHLETIKAYKKLDETTSIWTTQNFTAIDAAITKGKSIYGG